METLLQFALVLIVVAGAATFGISIVAGTLDLARLIWHRATHCALTPVSLHGEWSSSAGTCTAALTPKWRPQRSAG
jgi:hypothetical protein